MITIDNLLELVEMYNQDDLDKIRKAYEMADNLHKGQVRQSGEPYISHPLNVAYILAEMNADTLATATAMSINCTSSLDSAFYQNWSLYLPPQLMTLWQANLLVSGRINSHSL